MKSKKTKKQILSLLLSGKHPQAKKYAGKHVMVADREIIPVKEGEKAREDFKKLKEKYGHSPTLVFVPRQDVSYILTLCK